MALLRVCVWYTDVDIVHYTSEKRQGEKICVLNWMDEIWFAACYLSPEG